MNLSQWILSGVLIAVIIMFLYFQFKEKLEKDEIEEDIYSLDFLCREIRRIINEIVNMEPDVLRLNKRDLESRRELKRTLSDATRGCSQGYIHKKRIVLARIKSSLAGVLGVTDETIDEVIPFNKADKLSAKDKFEILLYLQIRNNNFYMFREICKQADLDQLKHDTRGYYYDMTEEDVERAFYKLYLPLSYDDKLNLITQRIYEETYGLSVIDMLIMEDDSLDSVSGGVSGTTTDNYKYREDDLFYGEYRKTKTFESVWIVYGGKPIHLKFLSFGTSDNLVRVIKNLSENGRTGHFTSSEGGSKNHLADGSRVTSFRPNNASQWAFFVRKFGSTKNYLLEDLITDKGCEHPLGILTWGVKGNLNMVYSGDQNSGKTTNTRASVRVIDRRQQIRTIEGDFELYLNDAYYDMNILGTRPSKSLGFSKLIELLKASEAHTILFGETAALEHAKHLFDLLMAGTKRIITTGHWPTTDELISYFVLAQGGFGGTGAQDIERTIARLLHIDVHHVKDNDGHRYIDRITEIIPYEDDAIQTFGEGIEGKLDKIATILERNSRKKAYYTRDIVIFKDGEYHMENPFSDRLVNIILRNLPPDEKKLFLAFNSQVKEV